MAVLQELRRDYVRKGVGIPEYYLGGDLVELDNSWKSTGIKTALSAKTYIKNVVEKYEKLFNETFKSQKSPMNHLYHPELDETPFLDQKGVSIFRGLVGSANWMITLGRFDVQYATGANARFSAFPREGHLEAMKRVFGYAKSYPNAQILVDPVIPDQSQFEVQEHNWSEFYPDAEEELPPDMPPPKGKPVHLTVYKDADHAHDLVTCRSVSGILVFANGMPVQWYSKRQKTIETSSYGSELVCARIATEIIIGWRYRLRMLGVPIDGPALMLGDNNSVILNTTLPSSQLKKKHNAIAYHRVREAVAAKILRFAKVHTSKNYADILNKPLPPSEFQSKVHPVLFRKPDSFTKSTVIA